jgi:hypothetical protein
MKKLISLCLFINFYLVAYNQIISGTILDKETRSIIDFASVYINGTFVGTQVDQKGNFKLEISGNESKPLTISALGYYSVTLTEFPLKKPLIVYMSPKTIGLPEVVVSAKSLAKARKKYLAIFRREFLGSTPNANYCKITNENDITFNYGSCKDTLKAFASRPLLINNNALGYKITYYLDNFEYHLKDGSFLFNGNMIFNEDLAKGGINKQLFDERRKIAFLGSRTHFFRELWANDLNSAGFKIQTIYGENLKYDKIVIQENNKIRVLKYSGKLCIVYSPDNSRSYIHFHKDKISFDASGYADLMGIIWEGDMASKRIADWLPYEYSIQD